MIDMYLLFAGLKQVCIYCKRIREFYAFEMVWEKRKFQKNKKTCKIA